MGKLFNKFKSIVDRRHMAKLLSDQMYSIELRDVFRVKYGIDVGMYSYGCFDSNRFNPNTTIGRYCSIADSALRFGRNHPMQKITMHPFFYNKSLGIVSSDLLDFSKCVVEDDVWIGAQSIILPKVQHIGRGAVIAAGSIVTKNVAQYSIVAGNPAKVVGMRFSDDECEWLEASRWWIKERDELIGWLNDLEDSSLNPLKN